MSLVTLIFICIVGYIISAFLAYKYIQLAMFHPKGSWRGLKPNGHELFIVLMPLLNTLFSIFWLLDFPIEYEGQNKKTIKFFEPKKPFKSNDNRRI